MPTARTSLYLLLAAIVVRLWVLYPSLPERVPTHFDAGGLVDGWSSRTGFVAIIGGLAFVMAGTFLALIWMTRRLPDSLINLPHRDYWLAPERREATLDDLEARLLWMGVATTLLVAAILEISARVALSGAAGLPGWAFPVLVGGYMVVIVAQSVALLLRYSRRLES